MDQQPRSPWQVARDDMPGCGLMEVGACRETVRRAGHCWVLRPSGWTVTSARRMEGSARASANLCGNSVTHTCFSHLSLPVQLALRRNDAYARAILSHRLTKMPTCIEICAGAGGMALGIQQLGFEHVLLVEKDERCIETLKSNGFQHVLHESVERVAFRPYKGRVDLVCGGCPCVSFSVGGKNAGADDSRNLWDEAVRCVSECKPKAFLFENSSHMTTPRHAPYLDELISRFERLGFTVTKHLVNAMHYGVPQCRKRLLLIGTRPGCVPYVPPPKSTPYPITIREALASLGPPNGQNGHSVHPAAARAYRGHTPSELDRPSHAVVSGVHGCPGGANCVQLDDGSIRYFTPRELARLQSFPDSFALPTTWSTVVRQLGNAAPPALIKSFAERLLPCLVSSPLHERASCLSLTPSQSRLRTARTNDQSNLRRGL